MLRADYNKAIEMYNIFDQNIKDIMGETDDDIAIEAGITATSGVTTPGLSQSSASPQVKTASTMNQQVKTPIKNAYDASKAAQKNLNKIEKSAQKPESPKQRLKNSEELKRSVEKVRELLNNMYNIIDSLKRKLNNRIELLKEDESSFDNLLSKKVQSGPVSNTIEVITFSYNNNLLENSVRGLEKDIDECLRSLAFVSSNNMERSGRLGNILNAPGGQLTSVLFAPYTQHGANVKVNTAQEYVNYLINNYRGEKREYTYTADQIEKIKQNASKASDIERRMNLFISNIENSFNQFKNFDRKMSEVYNSITANVNINENNKKEQSMYVENANKANILYNVYSSIISTYYELRLEQSLNYRAILKRFYNI